VSEGVQDGGEEMPEATENRPAELQETATGSVTYC